MAPSPARFQVRFEVDGDGNVKSSFEGISEAAKKTADDATAAFEDIDKSAYNFGQTLGQTVRDVTLALGAMAVSGLAVVIKNSIDTQNQLAQLDAVLKSTGQSANFTAGQIVDMANSIASNSDFSGGDITNAATRLLSYSGIVTDKFTPALQIAIDQAARLGISVEQSAEIVGRALESPKKAAAALAQQGFGASFTKEVRNGIAALVDAGKEAQAQQVILDILNQSYQGAAAAARDTLGGAFVELKNTAADLLQGDGKSQGLIGVREAVESLIETLKDPGIESGLQNLIELLLRGAAAAAKLAGNLGQKLGTGLQVAGLTDGSLKPADASTDALQQRLSSVTSMRNAQQNSSTTFLGFDIPSLAARRRESLANYDKEIAALQTELAKRKVSVLFNEGNAGDPQPELRAVSTPQAIPKVEDPALVKKRLAEQEAAAKKLESEYVRLKERMEQQVAVGAQASDASQVAKVQYEIETGSLKNLTAAKKQNLLVIADRVDQMNRELDLDRQLQEMDDRRQYVVDDIAAERVELGLSNDELEIRRNLLQAGVTRESAWGQAIVETTQQLQKQRHATTDQVSVMDSIRDAGKGLFTDATTGAESFGDAAVKALEKVRDKLLDVAAENLMDLLFGKTGSTGTGVSSSLFSSIGSWFSGLFGGGKATGGDVRAGSIHEVAEGGAPELLKSNGRTYLLNGADGTVVPASAAASGTAGGAAAPSVTIVMASADGTALQGEVKSQTWDGSNLNIQMAVSQAIATDAATNGSGIRTQQRVLGLQRQGVKLG